MPEKNDSRRNFMKTAGALVAAAAMDRTNPVTGIASQAPTEPHFDVKLFGARGDGKTIDSPAINKAIAAAAEAGGGTVFFPAGSYSCYSIRMKRRVTLYLSSGSVIVAAESRSTEPQGYDAAESNAPWESYQDYGHNHWHN
ncbi:MAG TPA: glycosyl hydrolase family 28-related protein, partial [Candidatus Acidoferrum sp.]|nr:glycosyl hydrolase family 28-related protein [Candidatus Acidoferrum sp.]